MTGFCFDEIVRERKLQRKSTQISARRERKHKTTKNNEIKIVVVCFFTVQNAPEERTRTQTDKENNCTTSTIGLVFFVFHFVGFYDFLLADALALFSC